MTSEHTLEAPPATPLTAVTPAASAAHRPFHPLVAVGLGVVVGLLIARLARR
jgi:hypothetical protein